MTALKNYSRAAVPVNEPLNSRQVVNNTGGYVFQVSDAQRLRRFLILGTDGGSYYASERKLTFQNVSFIEGLAASEPQMYLDVLIDVSVNALAPSQDATLYALAVLFNRAPESFKQKIRPVFNKIVRTATHLAVFMNYVKSMGGFGPAKLKAVQNWLLSKSPDQLAYQAVKYRSREGWAQADFLRKSHPVLVASPVAQFMLHGVVTEDAPDILQGFKKMSEATSIEQVLRVLDSYPSLPWETVPTQFLRDKRVWFTLFLNGQLKGQALLRNMNRLLEIGAFDSAEFAKQVSYVLEDESAILAAKLHPVNYINAMFATPGGYGNPARRKFTPRVDAALEEGFYTSFKWMVPCNKKILVALDVSSSMTWGTVAKTNLTPALGATLLAMQYMRVEPEAEVVGFSHRITDLGLKRTDSLDAAIKKTQNLAYGSTNPSLAVQYAKRTPTPYHGIVTITDNEVNHGGHVSRDIRDYRSSRGVDTRLVVVGMTATGFTLNDPLDPLGLDVVGFSSDSPKLITNFVEGRI